MLVLSLSTYKTTVICYCLECTGEGDIAIPVWERESNFFCAVDLVLTCIRGYKQIKNKCKQSATVSFHSVETKCLKKRILL